MVKASKLYKKDINKKFRDYQNGIISKIRSLESSDPKQYWAILNKGSNYKQSLHNISTEVFLEHFKKLNIVHEESEYEDLSSEEITHLNDELDEPISEGEVLKAINSLKNNKSCSDDMILNEFLKASKEILLSLYTMIFNLVLDSGQIPEKWTDGYIIPIYKQKGSINDPDNYRGITILSCLGKLFTAVLNNRINSYVEMYGHIGEEQAGFRKSYSTLDQIFNMKCLIDLYLCKKQRLFCAFIDYKKAFDSIDRIALWQKLLDRNIDGKVLIIIRNMYQQAKSCVRVNGMLSEFFRSGVRVRQGENLFPLLFSLFLSDLEDFMARAFDGLTHVQDLAHIALDEPNEEFQTYFKLYVLLYADDTVIFAESPEQLQAALNGLYLYCKTWKLTVNPTKTKIVVFSKSKLKVNPVFTYGEQVLNIEYDFNYLGILFDYKGQFYKARTKLIEQARKAMFAVTKKSRKLGLPVDIQFKLFDVMVVPIVLYGSEVWGYENISALEAFQFQYFKSVLHLKASTPKCMVYGETGRYPIDVLVKTRMVNFWTKILNGNSNRISTVLYKILHHLNENGMYFSQWLNDIRMTLQNCGLDQYWDNQFDIPHLNSMKVRVKTALQNRYVQNWKTEVDLLSKCLNYRIYKDEFKLENYFVKLPTSLANFYCRFRSMNHRLPIEYGRFFRVERAKRKCKLCNNGDIGDEYHYLFVCDFFKRDRSLHIPLYFRRQPNTIKLKELMGAEDVDILIQTAIFCKKIVSHFYRIHKFG